MVQGTGKFEGMTTEANWKPVAALPCRTSLQLPPMTTSKTGAGIHPVGPVSFLAFALSPARR